MPFHLSVVALILLSVVETIGMYIGLRPSQLLKKIAPDWLTNSPILNVKFSKALIFVFYSLISVLLVTSYSCLSLLYNITLSPLLLNHPCTGHCNLFYRIYDSLS